MSEEFDRLVEIMKRLRAPDGCPWDREQTMGSLAGYILEEAYELVDAIHGGDREEIREELGDLLLQIVFVAQIASEEGSFTINSVAEGIAGKMIRRHPHVFGSTEARDSTEVLRQWEKIKAGERESSAAHRSALDGIPTVLPALLKAYRMTQKAAGLGFDWDRPGDVIEKLREEVEELETALKNPEASAEILSEMGDVLFSMANLARHLGIEPETALQGCNQKFKNRFEKMEELAELSSKKLSELSPEDWEDLWEKAKTDLSGN